MSSHARTSSSHKSKNSKGHDEDSSGANLTPCNPSKPQSSKTLSAPAKQSHEAPSSGDRNELQEPALQRTSMKLSVQLKRETDDKYENEVDEGFCLSSQQPFQPAHHGLEENLFDEDKDTFISNYQSNSKPSRRHTSLEEKRIDLEMLKEKNQNLELRHTMKRAHIFSGPVELSIPTRF